MNRKIVKNINEFIKDVSDLNDTLRNLRDKDNRIIVINNSFLFRDNIKTNKNVKYLAFYPTSIPVTEENIIVIEGIELKSDYQIIKKDDNRIINIDKLNEALKKEQDNLGKIVYVLMGEIDKNVEIQTMINHSVIKKISFSPNIKNQIEIHFSEIKVKNIESEEENWIKIEKMLSERSDFDEELILNLKKIIGNAFDQIKKEAYLNLKIPEKLEKGKKYFLELISDSVKEQIKLYIEALSKLKSTGSDRQRSYNEILRISYNFSDDAIRLLKLLISVCDLKPIILWLTFNSHYRLTESIKLLPWSKQATKPSINKYVETIKKARNKSFHRLIPFSKSFLVHLPNDSIKDVILRIFSEFGQSKKSNRLEYKDKELVDVLMEFTRTSEEIVPQNFWEKNLAVLENTVKLIDETADAFRLLKS